MQLYYRIALGMCLLIGYLQALPIPVDDFGWDDLKDVSCKEGVNFTSPTNVTKPCYAAALKLFTEGWKNATDNCTTKEQKFRIGQTSDALNVVSDSHTDTLTKCNFPMAVHEKFEGFMSATKTFVEKYSSSE